MKRLLILSTLVALVAACCIAQAQAPREAGDSPDNRPAGRRGAGPENRRQGRAAQQVPAKSGVVKELTANPQGETDGLLLEDGTEIRFRPASAEKVKAAIAPKDRVTIEGWMHAGESVIHAATIENEASGKIVIVDRPPPGISIQGAEQGRNEPADEGDATPPRPRADDADARPDGDAGDGFRRTPTAKAGRRTSIGTGRFRRPEKAALADSRSGGTTEQLAAGSGREGRGRTTPRFCHHLIRQCAAGRPPWFR